MKGMNSKLKRVTRKTYGSHISRVSQLVFLHDLGEHSETKSLAQILGMSQAFGGLGRFRRLGRDYERLASRPASWHWVATIALLLPEIIEKIP